MALLLRWLHPDLDPCGERSVFVRRVTRAWNDLKTQDRRDAYDRSRPLSGAQRSGRRKRNTQPKSPIAKTKPRRSQPSHFGTHKYGTPNLYPNSFLRRVFQALLDRFAF
jgi:hypothetical protein